jgi:hypothetical protein
MGRGDTHESKSYKKDDCTALKAVRKQSVKHGANLLDRIRSDDASGESFCNSLKGDKERDGSAEKLKKDSRDDHDYMNAARNPIYV